MNSSQDQINSLEQRCELLESALKAFVRRHNEFADKIYSIGCQCDNRPWPKFYDICDICFKNEVNPPYYCYDCKNKTYLHDSEIPIAPCSRCFLFSETCCKCDEAQKPWTK